MHRLKITALILMLTLVLPGAAFAGTHQLLTFTDNSQNTAVPVSRLLMATITTNGDKGGNDATATQIDIGGSVVLADVSEICVQYGADPIVCQTPTTLTNFSITLGGNEKGGSNWTYYVSLNASAAGKTFSMNIDSISGTDNAVLPASTATRDATTPVCTENAPTVSVSPSAQTITVDAGSVDYTVSVTNNDSGPDCTDVTFDLTAVDTDGGTNFVVPSSLAPGSVTLAPSGSTTVTLTVTAQSGVTSATNNTYVEASEASHSTGTSNTVTTTIDVPVGCTYVDPTVTITTSNQTITVDGGTADYNVDITNNDTTGCADSTFSLSAIDTSPVNFDPSTMSVPSVLLSPQTGTTVTLTAHATAGQTTGSVDSNVRVTEGNHNTVNSNVVTTTLDVSAVGGDGNLLKRSVEETCHACHKTDKNRQSSDTDWDEAIKTHNSTNLSSTYWSGSGGWGVAGGKYGEFVCTTCHTSHNTKNIYLIRETITAPSGTWDSTGTATLTVDFRELAGSTDPYLYAMGNDSDNHTSSIRVCESCHTLTSFHRYDSSTLTDKTHNNAADCTGCHNHTKSFQGDCGDCHGRPPIDATTLISTPEPTQRDGQNGWSGWGSHPAHENYGFTDCAVCHNGGASADPEHQVTPLQITMGFTHVVVGGTYSAPSFPNANFSLENDAHVGGSTTVNYPSGTTRQCSSIYCHSNGNASFNSSPEWDNSSTGDCGTCHVNNNTWDAAKNMSGPHQDHIGSTAGYQFNCSKCHDGIVSDTASSANVPTISKTTWHVNGIKNAALKTTDSLVGSGATYDALTHTCSSVYCHSTGITPPSFVATPDWDITTSGACGTCHGNSSTNVPASTSHAAHVGDNTGTTGDYLFECQKCHDTIVSATANSSVVPDIADTNEHVNGTRTVLLDTTDPIVNSSASWNSGSVTCTNVYCHNPYIYGVLDGSQGATPAPAWTDDLTDGTGSKSSTNCDDCHESPPTNKAPGTPHDDATSINDDCSPCHNHNGGSHAQHINGVLEAAGSCLECHKTTRGSTPTRRAVLDPANNEFEKWSHHLTGITITEEHCYVCHAEGKADGKPDTNLHMDKVVDLRDVDSSTGYFQWDRSGAGDGGVATNYRALDNHCLSCHDGNGASVIHVAAGSASNPFNDTLTNGYDQVPRTGVLDVAGQFNTGNPSHHAVLGNKYGGTVLFDAGRMTGSLIDGTAVKDNVQPYCGDCHTVGDPAIGGHGSSNEYLLRNDTNTDALHDAASYVCFNCHDETAYTSTGSSPLHGPANGGDYQNSAGSVGMSTRTDGKGENITGMSCAGCHNTGGTGWGGIHGGSGTYTSVKSNTITKYRFMPGLSNNEYDPDGWEASGYTCYTNPDTNWSSCTQHSSQSVTKTNNFVRTLSY